MKRYLVSFLAALAALAAVGCQKEADVAKQEPAAPPAETAQEEAVATKAPPALEGGEWFQTGGKMLDWEGLRGKVVLLDFWAHW
jgi:hypothetical protein